MDSTSHRLLRKLKLYQTKARFYLVGRTEDKQHFRVSNFSRLEVWHVLLAANAASAVSWNDVARACTHNACLHCKAKELQAFDDPVLYTESQCKKLLGGLTLVLEVMHAYGLTTR